VARLRKEL